MVHVIAGKKSYFLRHLEVDYTLVVTRRLKYTTAANQSIHLSRKHKPMVVPSSKLNIFREISCLILLG
jgi:hypothetical protein